MSSVLVPISEAEADTDFEPCLHSAAVEVVARLERAPDRYRHILDALDRLRGNRSRAEVIAARNDPSDWTPAA